MPCRGQQIGTKRLASGVLLVAAASGLAGCGFVPTADFLGTPFLPYAAPAAPAVGVAAFMQKHGPSVRFENQSSVALGVRYWVGRMDISVPGGIADLRTRDDLVMAIPAKDTTTTQCGRTAWVTANSDAVVRVCIWEIPAETCGAEPAPVSMPPAGARIWWYELERPLPFTIVAKDDENGERVIESGSACTLRPMQPDEWIDGINGELPVMTAGR
ncbi:MAG TPA: hypothetical protein VG797_00860 [Phycisphaerales bacterium]|nr:hypothetical protein [Phycisphaerales bacterium]